MRKPIPTAIDGRSVASSHRSPLQRDPMSRAASFPLHHAVRVEKAGNGLTKRDTYMLYRFDEDGSPELVQPLLEFVLEHAPRRSSSWQRLLVRSVGLLIDFAAANDEEFAAKERPLLFERWAHALHDGTIGADGRDASGLYWRGRHREHVETLVNAATQFSDWLTSRHGSAPLNPWRIATVAERLVNARRCEHRSAHHILAHLAPSAAALETTRLVRAPGRRQVGGLDLTLAFDESRIWDLLLHGFRRSGASRFRPEHERMHLPGMLMTIAMHGGGLRRSELLHAYVDDVREHPSEPRGCQLRLYHPEQGVAPPSYEDASGRPITTHRTAYLRERWGMEPRSLVTGRMAAGFKELLLSNMQEKYADTYWFPSQWGEVFRHFFDLYIRHARSRHCTHPFLLVGQHGRYRGDPLTHAAFQMLHASAIRRIGLLPKWSLGTTPHAHRHAYGVRLDDAGVSPLVIQRAMHHRCLTSQERYKQPGASKVSAALAKAELSLAAGNHAGAWAFPSFDTSVQEDFA